MTSFIAAERGLSLWAALAGVATYCAHLGLGLLLLKCARLKLPSPWRQTAAVLTGILAFSLVVQCLAMAGHAGLRTLSCVWIAELAIGVPLGLSEFVTALHRPKLAPSILWLPLGIALLANTINLLVAAAPSTKIDELYYHMLLPARIAMDGGLRFYRFPWEAAILPQMIFQIGATPFHALGIPDAANLISWGMSLQSAMARLARSSPAS